MIAAAALATCAASAASLDKPGQVSLPMPYGTGRSLAISLLRSRGRAGAGEVPVARQILLQFARGNIRQLTYIQPVTWGFAVARRVGRPDDGCREKDFLTFRAG